MADYIIIGAGAAGAVLANRLTVDPRIRVTLIEAGGWDNSPFIHMPAGYYRLMQTLQLDWGYHTVPQPHVNGRVMFIPRAKSVGGSTTVNGMIYVRGNRADYDGWAKLGNRGWNYDSVLPHFRKAESWGGGGVPSTTRAGISSPISKAWMEAAQQAGYSYNDDLNAGNQEGVGPCDATIADGVRSSVSRCYLKPIRHRSNLTVITKAVASKILLRNGCAVGVEYLQGRSARTIHADVEVIVSGGAFNSPHLLLQISGIGDSEHLRRIGVKVEHELPGVGRNLQDHVGCGLKVRISKPLSALKYLKLHRQLLSIGQYFLTRPFTPRHFRPWPMNMAIGLQRVFSPAAAWTRWRMRAPRSSAIGSLDRCGSSSSMSMR
ncbi:GMC family oxidoreductase [Mesorhizobium sp. CO1-1-8]|uniref:GMC family oxidoreductase n=1 Tax=Mesorhizobium sp. CO1-1-8 TaxID=2876631 RepID=UPI001CD16673|nr:GMC family oxidoreductase N-terminal domain-containing protein [Mesorhizobium sp. CO1-1-8]MBZ9772246.1 GMC family oxidoreductase N-terminal domain-containing protein [Mesorhizobium sp. CO1-1-8]